MLAHFTLKFASFRKLRRIFLIMMSMSPLLRRFFFLWKKKRVIMWAIAMCLQCYIIGKQSRSLTFLRVPLMSNPLLKLLLTRQSLKEGSLIAIFNLTKFVWIFNWTMIENVRNSREFFCQMNFSPLFLPPSASFLFIYFFFLLSIRKYFYFFNFVVCAVPYLLCVSISSHFQYVTNWMRKNLFWYTHIFLRHHLRRVFFVCFKSFSNSWHGDGKEKT